MARSYWEARKKDAQFRQQLELDGTRVLCVDGTAAGLLIMRPVSDLTDELHTLCMTTHAKSEAVGASVVRALMSDAES